MFGALARLLGVNALLPLHYVLLGLAVLGAIGVAVTLFRVLRFIKINFLSSNSLGKYRKFGDWAVVTGASDGIGKEFAFELARRKFNVVLVARNKDKLQAVAKELATAVPTVETRLVVLDFAKATQENYAVAFAELSKLNVSVLVNNVGISYEFPQYFHDVDIAKDLEMLKVNCESQLCFTKAILKTMIERKIKGAIVNLSSTNGIIPPGLLSTYSGTKAFNRYLSDALSFEVKQFGIDVLSVTPQFVVTNMSGIKKSSFNFVLPKPTVKQTLNKIGATMTTCGHWHHDLNLALYNLFPVSFVGSEAFKMSLGVRKRALKKREAAAAGAAAPKS